MTESKTKSKFPTWFNRGQCQKMVDNQYLFNEIDHDEWQRLTDELGDPEKYNREGLVKDGKNPSRAY